MHQLESSARTRGAHVILNEHQARAVIAGEESRRYALRARIERQRARDVANPFARRMHLRAAHLHREAGRAIATGRVLVENRSKAEITPAFAYEAEDPNASQARPRVFLLMTGTAALLTATMGGLGLLFQLIPA